MQTRNATEKANADMILDKRAFTRRAQDVLDFAGGQLRHLVTAHPDYFPMYTVGGRWKHGGEAWTNWCEGFLGGQLWLLYTQTGDGWWRDRAIHYSRLIEASQDG